MFEGLGRTNACVNRLDKKFLLCFQACSVYMWPIRSEFKVSFLIGIPSHLEKVLGVYFIPLSWLYLKAQSSHYARYVSVHVFNQVPEETDLEIDFSWGIYRRVL